MIGSRRCANVRRSSYQPLQSPTPLLQSNALSTTSQPHFLQTLTKNAARSEAQAIPHVMVAPKAPTPDGENDRSMYDSGYGDARGYYEDGAYVAAPPIGPVMPSKYPLVSSKNTTSIPPYEAYTSHLLASFQRQRTLLRSTPPSSAIDALKPERCIVVVKSPFTKAFGEWQRATTSFDPSPVQMATLQNWSVLTLLRLATSSLKRGRNLSVRMGAWIWALLAKLDYGILNRSEASTVRDFGKKAVWMRLGFDEKLAEATQGLVEHHEEDQDAEEWQEGDEEQDEIDAVASGTNALANTILGTDIGMEEQEIEMDISSEEEGEILDSDDDAAKSGDVSKIADLSQENRKTSSPIPPNDIIYTNTRHSRKRNASSPSLGNEGTNKGTSKKLKTKADAFIHREAAIASAKIRLISQMGHLGDDSGGEGSDQLSTKAAQDVQMKTETEGRLPNDTTMGTLDMIILIVGEVFGQRDLLEFREQWIRSEAE
jgi:hypothetical protein